MSAGIVVAASCTDDFGIGFKIRNSFWGVVSPFRYFLKEFRLWIFYEAVKFKFLNFRKP